MNLPIFCVEWVLLEFVFGNCATRYSTRVNVLQYVYKYKEYDNTIISSNKPMSKVLTNSLSLATGINSDERILINTNMKQRLLRPLCVNSTSKGFEQIFDTIVHEDNIRTQYLHLPYPWISADTLSQEKNYYENTEPVMPFRITPSMALENVNHFLFKGSQSFE